MKTTIVFKMEIEVYDVDAFVQAARERAVKDRAVSSLQQAKREYTRNKLTDCAVMLLDPGEGPPGCEIEHSEAEVIR